MIVGDTTGLDGFEPGQGGLTFRDSMGICQAHGQLQTLRIVRVGAFAIAIHLSEAASGLEGVSQAPANACSTE